MLDQATLGEPLQDRVAILAMQFGGALYGHPTTGDLDGPATQRLRGLVPAHTLAALDRYVRDHRPTGDFVAAVLANDLLEAVGRADWENEAALVAIVRYLQACAPILCWGSRAAVQAWIAYGAQVRDTAVAAEFS